MYARLTISFLFILCASIFPQSAGATAYYTDLTPGVSCANNGLATTTAFCSIDLFAEAARSAGDILFVRRNNATTTAVITDLNFTSDGTIASPIIISADNDNLWNDASTTAQTYTVAVATSTFTASATITGIQAGDWFYVTGDCTQTYNSTSLNKCYFFYEVATISGTQLTLYMPYKGDQTGAGNSLVNLGKNPQWNIESGDFQWLINADYFWTFKGMNIRGTDANGQIVIETISGGITMMDLILTGNGASDVGLFCRFVTNAAGCQFSFLKSRIVNNSSNNFLSQSNTVDEATFADSLFSGSLTFTIGSINIFDSYGITTLALGATNAGRLATIRLRNVSYNSFSNLNTSQAFNRVYSQDDDTVIGKNVFLNTEAGSNTIPLIQSTTTVVRSGGGSTSIQVIPSTNISTTMFTGTINNAIQLFEYPIYTNTTSRQYDVYFMSTSTAAWTTDPLATELWIECEYWAHATGATSTRKILKSTGVVDFNGVTTWNALSVTCVPTQTGILYLRGWYAKTKEASVMNEFYVDGTPVITP